MQNDLCPKCDGRGFTTFFVGQKDRQDNPAIKSELYESVRCKACNGYGTIQPGLSVLGALGYIALGLFIGYVVLGLILP